MAYSELPKLKKNSVSTTIASPGINDTDTTIPVTELAVFYDSDSNLITKGIVIGYDNATETYAEEITITGASGTSGAGNLTGATRGVNADGTIGAAKAHVTTTNIAVMFSTGIYELIRENDIGFETTKADLASPVFTGTPTAPTAPIGTDTTQIATTAFVQAATRQILTANTTYYVATTGSDVTGDGSSGNPWATIQHAYDIIVATLDTAGYTVTIQVADGTYTTGIEITKSWMGGGNVHILGNTSTPSDVVISTGGNRPFYAHDTSLPTTLVFKGFQLNTTTNCIYFGAIGSLRIGNIYFSNSGGNTIAVGVASQIYADNESFRVLNSDTLYSFISASNMSMIQGYGMNIDYIGSPTYNTSFINIKSVSSADLRAMTFSGSATGAYYYVSLNGVLYISGATLPGNTAGTTSTGGQVL